MLFGSCPEGACSGGGRGSTRAWCILLATALAVWSETALAQSLAADAGTGYPDNPVSYYVDHSSDGLTSVEMPGSSAASLSSVEVKTPDAEPVKAPKPAEWMHLLPAGGAGARITVAKANQVNARADVAFSKQGVSFYFAVGEAF